ncbi:PA14 domain-containing protein [uncultured Tateyamaria sp.]|uniref:PA14 domain-containing protein n=1 Tax=uncultured Tateyamaria sp. TaxID=455651 RepID=UPI00261DBD75|nr:PA14 domain-containing protein [uncultured Tateyamaria sp.]
MKMFKTAALAATTIVLATATLAAPLKLTPANPQPSGLKQGLAVEYAYPPDVKSLNQANRALKRAKAGPALSGLDYRDTLDGDNTLTAKQAHNVVAGISGYVKFDAPGTYNIDFLTNDGLDAKVGGQTVGYFDGRQKCFETRAVQVEVPQAGWYPVDITYFQRAGTACLHMRAGQGAPEWMPDAAFGH